MKLKKLNEEQIVKLEETKNKWLNNFFSCKSELNKDKATEGIEWLYEISGLKKPMIIFVDSPLACQFACDLLKKMNLAQVGAKVRDQVWDQVGDQVWAQVWAQVEAQVRDQVGAQVGDQVWDQVRDQVGAQVGAQVGDQVWAQVWAQVEAQVRDQVGDQKIKWESFASYGSVCDYVWNAFYDFFTQIGIISNDKFNKFKSLLLSNIYDMIQLDGLCIVSKMPVSIKRNNSNLLHDTSGYAIEFYDGYGQYYINGRSMPDWIFKEEITKDKFLSEKNSDVKGGIYEILGQRKMMEMLGAVSIDKKTIVHANGDLEEVELLKTMETFEEIDNMPFCWVSMCCPSTGTTYLQGVEPKYNDALSAIASLSPFSPEEYSFNLRS